MKNRWMIAALLALVPAAYGAQRIGTLPSYNWPGDAGKTVGLGPSGSSGNYIMQFGTSTTLNVRDFGAIPDDGLDDSVAINRAISSVGATGVTTAAGTRIYIPRGTYDLIAGPVRLNREVVLFGDGGSGRASPSQLRPAKNISGIVVERGTTSADGGWGDWSVMRDIAINYATQATSDWQGTHTYMVGDLVRSLTTGSGVNKVAGPNWNPGVVFRCTTAGTSGGSEPVWGSKVEGDTITDGGVTWTAIVVAGVRMRARSKLENFYINNSPGHGVRIDGSSGGTPSTNANGWRLEYGRIESAGLDGVYIVGEDSNAGLSSGVDIAGCGYWCLDDTSFLGNTHNGDEGADCALGPYRNSNVNAVSVYEGCYSESGQPPSAVVHPSMIIGGTHGAGFATGITAGAYMSAGRLSGGWDILSSDHGSNTLITTIAANNDDSTFFQFGVSGTSENLFWRYMRSGYTAGFFRFDQFQSDFVIPMLFATASQAIFPRGTAVFPEGIALGGDLLGYGGPRFQAESALPTSGTHRAGDITFNSAPTGPLFWQNVSAGTPGSWTPVGGPHSSTTGNLLSFAGTGGLQWQDSGVASTNVVTVNRNVFAGTGLTGGGALTSDITIAASFGSTGNTICQGNDSRLSDSRTPSGSAGGDLQSTYPNPRLLINDVTTMTAAGSDQAGATAVSTSHRRYWINSGAAGTGVRLPTGGQGVTLGDEYQFFQTSASASFIDIYPGVGDKFRTSSTNQRLLLYDMQLASLVAVDITAGVTTWEYFTRIGTDDAASSARLRYTMPTDFVGSSNTFTQGITMSSTATITFNSSSAFNIVSVPDNTADAFSIKEGSNKYMTFITTNGAEGITIPKNIGYTPASTLTPSGSTQTVDWSNGVSQKISLSSAPTGSVTLTLSNPLAGATYTIEVTQGANSTNLTWPGTVKWAGGVAPTVTAASGSTDLDTCYYNGSNYLCSFNQNYQ